MATSVATLIRRPSGARERRTAAAPDSTPAWINHHSAGYMASQPVRHGRPTCGAAFARKKLPRRLKALALEADYEFARQSLAAAVARAYYLYHRGRATGSQRTGNARYLPGVFKAHRRAQTAGLCERLRRVADQVAHCRRRGCALRRAGGAGADDSRDRGRDQSLPCRQV